MKQRLDLDLSAEKAALCAAIDAWFGRQVALRWPLAMLHAVKARQARERLAGGETAPALLDEAVRRRQTVDDLCRVVLDRAAEAEAGMLTFDAQRLAAKADVMAATTGQQLAALRARVAERA